MRRERTRIRLGVLVKAWGRIAGPPAFRRAFVPYGLLAMAAMVIFVGPNGMRAAELTSWAASSRAAAALFRGAWLLLAWPTARALLRCPAMGFVRSLPVSWNEGALAVLPWLALVELPWIWLFAVGAGAGAGVAAGVNSAAIHALGAWAPRPRPTAALAFVLAGVLLLMPTELRGRELFLAVPIGVLAWGLRGVWCRDPRDTPARPWKRSRPIRLPLASSAELSLARVLVRSLWRGHRGLLGRWAAWSVVPVVAAALATKSNALREEASSRLLLAALAFGGVLGAAGAAAASSRLLNEAGWWFELLGLSETRRRAGTMLALAGFAVLIALSQSGLTMVLRAPGESRVGVFAGALPSVAAGLVGAASAVAVTAAAARGTRRDGARLIVFVLLVASLEGVGAWRGGVGGLLVAAVSSCGALVLHGVGSRRSPPIVTAGTEET